MTHPRKLRTLFWTALLSLAAAAPATAPSTASPPQTGEITLHFTQRSPLSSPSEIARRLSSQVSDLGRDYDLTTYTFRAYVPPNYDPSTPYGVFVYLGNHDVNTVATLWEPLFDKSHMIYITPDWHSPMTEWQLVGLGFDAIDNLKRLYNIDTHRLYDMWFNSGSLQMPLAGADVYTGMILGEDWDYFRKIDLPGNHYLPAKFPAPPIELLRKARAHGVVLIGLTLPDPGAPILSTTLKQDDFTHVLSISQTSEQLHYPNYAASWITDPVLPFLDKAAAAPTTAPSNASPPQTGEITLHFTQRSPLSSPMEIARRLARKQSDLEGGDYDLANFPFRTYVPPNYDPSTSYGVFVFLGSHDVNSVPTRWEPLFDKSHMIYITPDWGSLMGDWQLIGLGFDAIDNLKRLYNIDTHRLYVMFANSGSVNAGVAGADVYSGMVICEGWRYWRRIDLPGDLHIAPNVPPPLPDLLRKAKPHAVVLITLGATPGFGATVTSMALKQDGFAHVLSIAHTVREMHYPNFSASWITDPVLPFLDKAAATPATAAATRPSSKSSSARSEAQHLLSMAKLYIDNGNTESARTNLQFILAKYPDDPAAIPAKKLLDSLPPPPPPQ